MEKNLEDAYDQIKSQQFLDFNKDLTIEEYDNGFFDDVPSDPLDTYDYYDEMELMSNNLEVTLPSTVRLRRSISCGNIYSMQELRNEITYDDSNKDDDPTDISASSTNVTNMSSARSTSRQTINRLAQPKRRYRSDQNINNDEYVPMAEAVRKFENGTPARFRSKANPTKEVTKHTVPHTPKLKTSFRSRPVYVLSAAEEEQRILEEAKKFKFKANPINKNVFKSPLRSTGTLKKTTVPEPFKLTMPIKTMSKSPVKKAPEFHARPVPKYIYQPKLPVIKLPMNTQLTQPNIPSFVRRLQPSPKRTVAVKNKNETVQQSQPKLTKVKPFSFEKRDTYIKVRKEKLIEKVLEDEKKAREFHAKPIPKAVLNASVSQRKLPSSTITRSDEGINTICFKARPAAVLHKKPFEPILGNRPLPEIDNFILNTDVRIKERKDFDRKIKEKEEMMKQQREKEEMLNKKEEEEQILRFRKNAEFKAHEIRKYKEVKIASSEKVTNPISPSFHSKRGENKENIQK